MTNFYRFDSSLNLPAEFVREDGIQVSVIGDWYEPAPDPLPEDYQPVYIGYLVNTTAPVDEWAGNEVWPSAPMRIFG